MNEIKKILSVKETENGDIAYSTTGNPLVDILFLTSYFEKHLDEVHIGDSEEEKLFAMFIRDCRYGLGRRDLGRKLMELSKVSAENIIKAGRYDDLWHIPTKENLNYLQNQLREGNELAKKWMPRLVSKDRNIAKAFCKAWGLTEKGYRKLIKCDSTVEYKLSFAVPKSDSHPLCKLFNEGDYEHPLVDKINFEQVPSLAMIKYYNRFLNGEDTRERFLNYLDSVKKGESKLNVSTTNVYDIYRNMERIDADLYFDKLKKIEINCIPIIDVSGSMHDGNDSIGKALSIGHYLAKCSTYLKEHFITFSREPELVKLKGKNYKETMQLIKRAKWQMNTDFGAVMDLLQGLKKLPDYLVVLSDMEFDRGSNKSKEQLQQLWREKGYKTKIVWINFNARNKTIPELDEMGNLYFSGYTPWLLKYLEVGFNASKFLNKLLSEYKNKINL